MQFIFYYRCDRLTGVVGGRDFGLDVDGSVGLIILVRKWYSFYGGEENGGIKGGVRGRREEKEREQETIERKIKQSLTRAWRVCLTSIQWLRLTQSRRRPMNRRGGFLNIVIDDLPSDFLLATDRGLRSFRPILFSGCHPLESLNSKPKLFFFFYLSVSISFSPSLPHSLSLFVLPSSLTTRVSRREREGSRDRRRRRRRRIRREKRRRKGRGEGEGRWRTWKTKRTNE